MDTRFLQTYLTVCDAGSFAAAARLLSLTPAAVAQRIRALEQELGIALVQRVGREVRTTEAGVAVAQSARQLLSCLHHLKGRALEGEVAGELRLGAISTLLTGLMPGLLKIMLERYPGVAVHVTPATSSELYEMLEADVIDAAFLVMPPFRLSKALQWQEVRAEPLILIAPADVAEDDPLTLLRQQPFLRYDRRHWGGRLAGEYLRRIAIVPDERLELDALDAIAVMVSSGLGVSLVPEWSAPWPEGLSLKRVKLPPPVPVRRIGLLSRHSSPRSTLVSALARICQSPRDSAL